MMLSPNFSLNELTKSQLAARHGIDNTPPPPAVENLTRLARNILQPVRDHYGRPFSPSSGYRSVRLNRLLGSSDDSQHVKGEAADFEVPGIDNLALARWIAANLEFDQLILEHYDGTPWSGWVHCSYRAGRNRREVLTIGPRGVARGLPA